MNRISLNKRVNHGEALTHAQVEEVILPIAGLVKDALQLVLLNYQIEFTLKIFIRRGR